MSDQMIQTGEPGRAVAARASTAVGAPTEQAAALSPMALIQIALQSNTPAAELKELVSLAEHVEERNARKAFFEALRRFQQACPPIMKNKTAKIPTKGGGSYSFKYAELDEIERHVKPYLEAEGLAYNFDTIVEGNGALLTNICTLRHVDGHSEQSRFTLPTSSESAMTAQQRFSAANNFAKRNTLPNVLGISITDKEVPDDEVDPTTISDDESIVIDDLITESGVNRARFLAWLEVETVEKIRAADYDRAITALHAAKAKKETTS